MGPEHDYYAVLGVAPDAEREEIRKAFRERVRACHPDRLANLDEDLRRLAEEKMVQLNEAYAVLRNPARRAAYDDRHRRRAAQSEAVASEETERHAPAASTTTHRPQPATTRGEPLTDPSRARSRIGEQRFVARAATEEFQHGVKRAVAGQVSWTPLAFRDATFAMQGRRNRSNLYFVLLAAPQLDDKQLQRFLQSIDGFGDKLKSRLFGRDRLYGFAGAVEFADRDRQHRSLQRFNQRHTAKTAVQPATLIDLVNWHVVPGEVPLQERLESLLRGS